MEVTEGYANPPARYSIEALARFIEWVVQHHPDGAQWAHFAAIVRSHPDRFFYVSPSARIVDLVSSIPAGHAPR